MNIPVLVEPVENDGYRATSGPPLPLTVEAATRDEAVAKLREQLRSRLQKGAELVSLEMGEHMAPNPWLEFAGMFKDDPLFEDWKKSMAEYRRKVEAEPDYP